MFHPAGNSDSVTSEDTVLSENLDVSLFPVVGSRLQTAWRSCTSGDYYLKGPQNQHRFVIHKVAEEPKEIAVKGSWPKFVLMWGDVEIAGFKVVTPHPIEDVCDIFLESHIRAVDNAWEVLSILFHSGMGFSSEIDAEDVEYCCDSINTDKLIVGQTTILVKSRFPSSTSTVRDTEFKHRGRLMSRIVARHQRELIARMLAKFDIYLSENDSRILAPNLYPNLQVPNIFGRFRNWGLCVLAAIGSFSCFNFCFWCCRKQRANLRDLESHTTSSSLPLSTGLNATEGSISNNDKSDELLRRMECQRVERHPGHLTLPITAEPSAKTGVAPTHHGSESAEDENEHPRSQVSMGSVSAKLSGPDEVTEINDCVDRAATTEEKDALVTVKCNKFSDCATVLRRSSTEDPPVHEGLESSKSLSETDFSSGSMNPPTLSNAPAVHFSGELDKHILGMDNSLGRAYLDHRRRSRRRRRYSNESYYSSMSYGHRQIGRKNLLLMIVAVLTCIGGIATAVTNPAKRVTWFERVQDTSYVVLGLFIPLFALLRAILDGKLRVRLPLTRAPKSVKEVVSNTKDMNRQQVLESAAWCAEWSNLLDTENTGFKLTDTEGKIKVGDEVQLSDNLKQIWKFGEQCAFNTLSGRVFEYDLVPRREGCLVIRINRREPLTVPRDAKFFVGRCRKKLKYVIQ